MAIGDISASGGIAKQAQSGRAGQVAAQYGQGLSSAITDLVRAGVGYATTQEELSQVYDQRILASHRTEAETSFVNLQASRAERFTTFARERSGSPAGLTSDYDKELEAEEKAFITSLEPRLAQEYNAKLQQDRASRRAAMFGEELKLLDARDQTMLTQNLNTIGTAMKAGQASLEDSQAQWEGIVANSGLPPAVREAMALQGKQTLQQLQFGTEVEAAAMGRGTTDGPQDGSDVVAAGLSPQSRAVLNAISSREASAYNVLNGGETFDSYADHPRRKGANGESTAAGRYQFIASTWDAATAAYERATGVHVPDFSPEWQDRVAIFWAEKRYNERKAANMPSFAQIISSNDPQQYTFIRRVLGNPIDDNPNSVEWAGLGDAAMGGEAAGDAKFIEAITGLKGLAGGGTGPSQGPNPWTDGRFADVGLDDKVRLASLAQESAAKAARDASAQAKAQADALKKQAFALGYGTGDIAQMDQLRNMPGFTAEVEKKFREGVDGYWKKDTSAKAIEEKMVNGTALTERDMEGYRIWFGDSAMQGLADGDVASYQRLGQSVSAFGLMPKGASGQIESALTNPATREQALQFMASAMGGDTSLLARSGFSASSIADAEIYRRLAARSGPEEALAQYGRMMESRGTLNITPSEAAKATDDFFKDRKLSDLTNLFDGIFTSEPKVPQSEAVQARLHSDAYSAYKDGILIYGGDTEKAQVYMETFLKNVWGPSAVGSQKELMRYPPEKFYTSAGQDPLFLEKNLRNSLAILPAELGVDSTRPFGLVGDAQTEKEVRAGAQPTYQIIAQDKNGGMVMIPGRFGGKELLEVGQAEMITESDRRAAWTQVDSAFRVAKDARAEWEAAAAVAVTPEAKQAAAEAKAKFDEAKAVADKKVTAAQERGFLSSNNWHIFGGIEFGASARTDVTSTPTPGQIDTTSAAANWLTENVGKLQNGQIDLERGLSNRLASALIRARQNPNADQSALERGLVAAMTQELNITPDIATEAVQRWIMKEGLF